MVAGKRSTGETTFDVLNAVFLTVFAFVCIYPMLYVIFASLSDTTALGAHSGVLFGPIGFSLESYRVVFHNPSIGIGYLNTLCYLACGTILSLVLTSLGAYGLSRKNLLLGKPILLFILFTMFFSGGLIPGYLLVKGLGLVDTRLAMILPSAISVWNLIVMRTSFLSLPDSMEESARMDGAGDVTVLFRIVLPLSKAVLAVMGLFYGVSCWNNWFDAMIYLRERSLYPLQLILREILITNRMDAMMAEMDDELDKFLVAESLKYSTIVVATVPILLVYPFLQKYFVKGVMVGAIKG